MSLEKDCPACGGYHYSEEGIVFCKFIHALGGHYEPTEDDKKAFNDAMREARRRVKEREERVMRSNGG